MAEAAYCVIDAATMATATAATAERDTAEPEAQIVAHVVGVHVPVMPDKATAYVFKSPLIAARPTLPPSGGK